MPWRQTMALLWKTAWTWPTPMTAALSMPGSLKLPETVSVSPSNGAGVSRTAFTDGAMNADIYFNSPLHFVRNLSGAALKRVQQITYHTLVCG